MMYYTFIKGEKNGKEYYALKRSYYSKTQNRYVDASFTFLDSKEVQFLKECFLGNSIAFKEFDFTKSNPEESK